MKINIIAISLYVLVGSGCASVDKSKIDNLNDGQIIKLGHAGMGFESVINPFNPYPPNGITSLTKAMELGADGVEVDLQMTKDGVLILFHDLHLEESTDIIGCIQDRNWAEIENASFKIGAFFDLFHDDKILRLDSLLAGFQKMDNHPYIHFDMRAYNPCNTENQYEHSDKMCDILVHMLDAYNVPAEKMLLISTSKKVLAYLQSLDSNYPISFEETSDFNAGLATVNELGLTSLTIKRKLLTTELVAKAHAQNIEVVTFGGKSRSGTAQIIGLNPEAVHTNNIEAMVDLLAD